MGNAAFVLIAVAVAALLSFVAWLRHRKPKTFMSSIQEFEREMNALGREPGSAPTSRWRSRQAPRSSDPGSGHAGSSPPAGGPAGPGRR